jgi:hypothetical protein
MQRFAIPGALMFLSLVSTAVAGDVVLVHHSFAAKVVSVDAGITEIVPSDFFEISFTIDQSVTDQNSSVGGGNFPGLAVSFSLAAGPPNAGTWQPVGTFDRGGSNYVTNAFGDNFTFQMRGSGFPNGGPDLPFFDLDLNWTWPGNITDSGLNDHFVQQFGGGTFDPARAVLRPSSIRFLVGPGDFRRAIILPEIPTLAGDYNANGVVDAADYVVWRNAVAGPGILLNDATPGTVSAADYDTWRAHFGQTTSGAGASVNAGVPEPATTVMLIVGIFAMFCPNPRKHHKLIRR